MFLFDWISENQCINQACIYNPFVYVIESLWNLAAIGNIKIGGPSTSAPTSDFSKKKMHMQTRMCWVYM